jgi:hypothetical protein
MLLLLLYFLVLAFFFLTWGVFIQNLLKINQNDFSITLFLGLGAQCVGLSLLCLFYKIGYILFLFNLIVTLVLFFWQRKKIKTILTNAKSDFSSLSIISKLLCFILFILTLLKSAQTPVLVDNETYYIQTIKWINEFGIVKGLANLHVFLAQTSPLHILQAGFNFNFITDRFNHINGFIYIIGILFFIAKLEKYQVEKKQMHWFYFTILLSFIYFQFTNPPSPDLILVIGLQIVIFLFIEKTNDINHFKIATLLLLLLVFIKITIAPMVLLLFCWIYLLKKRYAFFVYSMSIFALLLLTKNSLLTGYPLYPFDFFPLDVDWKIPSKLLQYIAEANKNESYFKDVFVENPTFYSKIKAWLHQSGMNRIFNWGIVILFIFAPFTKEIRTQKNYSILYIVLLISFLLVLFTSPQFRYFLPEFIFLFALTSKSIVAFIKLDTKIAPYLLIVFTSISIVCMEYIDLKKLNCNPIHQQRSKLKWSQLIYPEKNSIYSEIQFTEVKNGNLKYNSPKENFFFFGTANGSLPCVNKVQIDYFESDFHFKPQLRTNDLKDGFYSKVTKSNSIETKTK